MNYILWKEKGVNLVEKEKLDVAGIKTSMCVDTGLGNTVIAGESREGWRVYKLYEGAAGEEAPKLGVVQVIEHGSLRSHEYIRHLENYRQQQININSGNTIIFFTENNHLRSSVDNARGKQKGQLLHNPFEN